MLFGSECAIVLWKHLLISVHGIVGIDDARNRLIVRVFGTILLFHVVSSSIQGGTGIPREHACRGYWIPTPCIYESFRHESDATLINGMKWLFTKWTMISTHSTNCQHMYSKRMEIFSLPSVWKHFVLMHAIMHVVQRVPAFQSECTVQ